MKRTKKHNKVYLNEKQILFLKAPQKNRVWIGGRGGGKSAILGWMIMLFNASMPRSMGFILGRTPEHIKTKMLPSALKLLNLAGIKEHKSAAEPGLYVIGRKPPDWFNTPYQPVLSYRNMLTLWTGTTVELIGFQRKDGARGGSYDWMLKDEACLSNQQRYLKEVDPTIRGENIWNSPHHLTKIFTSSMPWTHEGMWVPDMGLVAEEHPDDVFYIESTAADNLHVLGADYLKKKKLTTDPLTFAVEYMNKRITKTDKAFYPAFSHAKNVARFLKKKYYDPTKPLLVSFDVGYYFSCCVVGQEVVLEGNKKALVFFEDIWAASQSDQKITTFRSVLVQLTARWCSHKGVTEVWGDRSGNFNTAQSLETIYTEAIRVLGKAGFSIKYRVQGGITLHHLKHEVVNMLLSGNNTDLPIILFDEDGCKDVITSIENSETTAQSKKDKTSERNLNFPQEKAPHLSDAFDYLTYNKYNKKALPASSKVSEAMFI